jgi:hypothetical protein
MPSVDMTGITIQSSDSESREWLNLRAFNTPVEHNSITPCDPGEMKFYRFNSTTSGSEVKIRSFVFIEDGPSLSISHVFVGDDFSKPIAFIIVDGYFEAELDDINQPLYIIAGQMNLPFKLLVRDDCGLFIVLKENPNFDKNLRFGFNPK